MHCSSFESEGNRVDEGEILVAIASLVSEGRIPGKSGKTTGFYEGPHCVLGKTSNEHSCNSSDPLCLEYEKVRSQVLELWQKGIPLCVEVLLTAGCSCKIDGDLGCAASASEPADPATESGLLLEQWFININHRRIHDKTYVNLSQLMNAIRSQLHFSQISAWLSTKECSNKITRNNIMCRLSVPGETLEVSQFTSVAVKHDFPITDIGNGLFLQISLLSLPRLPELPTIKCSQCDPILNIPFEKIQIDSKKLSSQYNKSLVDDRMYTPCTLKGKHRCEDYDEFDCGSKKDSESLKFKRICHPNYLHCQPSTSKQTDKPITDLRKAQLVNCLNDTFECVSRNSRGHHTEFHPELKADDKRNLNLNVDQQFKSLKSNLNPCCGIASYEKNAKEENKKKKGNDLKQQSNGDIFLNAILRSCHSTNTYDNFQSSSQDSTNDTTSNRNNEDNVQHKSDNVCCMVGKEKVTCDFKCVQTFGQNCPNLSANEIKGESDSKNSLCDNWSASDIFSTKDKAKHNIYIDKHCDSPIPKIKCKKIRDISNIHQNQSCLLKYKARQKITFDDDDSDQKDVSNLKLNYAEENLVDVDEIPIGCLDKKSCNKFTRIGEKDANNLGIDIPSALDQAKFRKSLDNATSMVFHSRTGLPLTSSPAPVRRGKSCFDFDSSINSVSAIGNALFSLASDDESESDGGVISPCSPDSYSLPKREPLPTNHRRKHPNSLLGTFEESVLNGRLEPVSTVHGFTAELGASGSFVPKHLVVPVTVFFYSLGDNEKVSSPYLGHINLGRKGYQVPKSGTVQVTLFNPLGTVVKMFVIMYDLSDMPPNTQTFIRQRTLYMPIDCQDKNSEWGPKWLRYLIHLRFMSSKSGRIYLHSDIRMIIFRKSDLDTATAHGIDMSYELRSFTHMPANPRFSPRK